MTAQVHPGPLAGMDELTAALILQLQLRDCEEPSLRNMEIGVGDEESDAELAIRLSREEIERYSSIFRDHTLAEAVANGLDPDIDGALVLVEEQAGPVVDASLTEETAAGVETDLGKC
jgi:hypothetical protein